MKKLIPLLCLAVFHSPDGKELRIESKHIVAIRSTENVKGHVAPGTNTIIYTPGQTFGITENLLETIEVISECVDD